MQDKFTKVEFDDNVREVLNTRIAQDRRREGTKCVSVSFERAIEGQAKVMQVRNFKSSIHTDRSAIR